MKTQLVLCIGGSLLAGMSACKDKAPEKGSKSNKQQKAIRKHSDMRTFRMGYTVSNYWMENFRNGIICNPTDASKNVRINSTYKTYML